VLLRGRAARSAQRSEGGTAAKAGWSGLPSDARRDFIDWIDAAKVREARKRRVERACAMLAAGKRQPPTERSA